MSILSWTVTGRAGGRIVTGHEHSPGLNLCAAMVLVALLAPTPSADVTTEPGYDIQLFADLPLALPFQITLGGFSVSGDLILATREAVGDQADQNILAVDRLGNCRLISAPQQYPEPPRAAWGILQHESDPDLMYVIDLGNTPPPYTEDGRLFTVDLTTGEFSTVIPVSGGLLDPQSMDRDPLTGDIFITDSGAWETDFDGAVYRWDGLTLTEVVSAVDPFGILFLEDGTYWLSADLPGISGVFHMSGPTVLDTVAVGLSHSLLAYLSESGAMPEGLYAGIGAWPGASDIYWLPDEDGNFVADSIIVVAHSTGKGHTFDSDGRLIVVDDDNDALMTISRVPAYEILSATFDQSIYQNGIDTAHLTVVTRSNWGSSQNLELTASLVSNLGDEFDLGTSSFELTPGDQHTALYDWDVPNAIHPWDFDLHLSLVDQGVTVASLDVPAAFGGMVLTPEQLQQFEEELTNSACLPPGVACSFSMVAAIPHAGAPAGVGLFVDAGCKMGERLAAGNYLGAGVAGIGGLIGGIDLVLDALPGPGTVASAITGAAGTAIACTDDLILEDLYGSGRGLGGRHNGIDSLAAHIRTTFPEIEMAYSSEIMVQGGASLLVGVNDHWTNLDSLGLTRTFVFGTHGDTLNWAHVGPEPSPIGSGLPNPRSAVDIEFHATQADTLDVGFLYRHASEEVFWIRYDPFVVTDSSIAYLALADTLSFFPLLLDLDGDGEIDEYKLPLGFSAVEDAKAEHRSPPIYDLSAHPNPAVSSAAIAFAVSRALSDVEVVIYDLSGREVARMALGDVPPGRQEVVWETSGQTGRIPAGIYHYRVVHSHGQSEARKAILLR